MITVMIILPATEVAMMAVVAIRSADWNNEDDNNDNNFTTIS